MHRPLAQTLPSGGRVPSQNQTRRRDRRSTRWRRKEDSNPPRLYARPVLRKGGTTLHWNASFQESRQEPAQADPRANDETIVRGHPREHSRRPQPPIAWLVWLFRSGVGSAGYRSAAHGPPAQIDAGAEVRGPPAMRGVADNGAPRSKQSSCCSTCVPRPAGSGASVARRQVPTVIDLLHGRARRHWRGRR